MSPRGRPPTRARTAPTVRRAAPWIAAWTLFVGAVLTLATVLGRGAELRRDVELGGGAASGGAVHAPSSAAKAATLRVRAPGDIGSFEMQLEEQGAERVVRLRDVAYRDGGPVIGDVEVRDKDDGFVLRHGEQTFRFKAKDESGYSIRNDAGVILWRVKIKEDKFNVYDGSGKRITYGKVKKGALQLRSDDGATIGSISGTTDLSLAAILAVPIPVEVRAAALAHRVEQRLL